MKQIGRYRLDAVHGVGAFATVWRGHDPELDAPVAIKVLADNWAHNGDVRERFLEEARLLRRIVDPRVVRVHDVGVESDRPYFVMDFLDGGTLASLTGTLPVEQALSLAAESARAVQALHDQGVLHRDIKPSNLLLRDGHVLVSDLGSAKRLAEASGYTVTTGTPAYMPPEQAYGKGLDGRSDVYALGVVTHELLTGKLPFDDPLTRKANDRPPSTGAGADVDRILSAAMSVKPTDRPETPGQLADLLEGTTAFPKAIPAWFVVALMLIAFASATATTWYLGR